MVVHKMMSVPAFSNYDGVEPEDALGKVVKKYLDEGNTTAWVFNALPAGFGDVFGNGVQAYVSGEKATVKMPGQRPEVSKIKGCRYSK